MSDQAAEVMKLVGYTCATPGENVALIGVSLDRVRRNIWRVILNAYDRRWVNRGIKHIDTIAMRIEFSNGSQLQCYGINRPEQLRGHGQRFTAVYLDIGESQSESEAALMMQLAIIMNPDRPDPPMPKPVFGL